MVFHGDYEESLDTWESRNSHCPVDIRIGDLVRPRVAYLRGSVGVVVDVYRLIHEESDESWWVSKVHINNEIHIFPVKDVDLVKRG